MPGGRPTKYSEDIIQKVDDYLKGFQDDGDVVPTHESLALFLDVGRRTLYDWAEKFPEFSHMLEKLNAKQATLLLNQGLVGNFNSQIAKLMLGKQGYSEKQEIDHTTKGKEMGIPVHQFVKSEDVE